jgi:hypothetical protein
MQQLSSWARESTSGKHFRKARYDEDFLKAASRHRPRRGHCRHRDSAISIAFCRNGHGGNTLTLHAFGPPIAGSVLPAMTAPQGRARAAWQRSITARTLQSTSLTGPPTRSSVFERFRRHGLRHVRRARFDRSRQPVDRYLAVDVTLRNCDRLRIDSRSCEMAIQQCAHYRERAVAEGRPPKV